MQTTTKKFQHPYKDLTTFTVNDIGGIIAFISVLAQLLAHIQEATKSFDKQNKMIDAEVLLDMIGNTLPEVNEVLARAQTQLKMQQIIFAPFGGN